MYDLTIDQSSHDGSFLHSTDQNREGDRQYPTDQYREGDQSSHDGSHRRFIDQYRESDQQYASGHDHGGVEQYSKDKRISDEKDGEDSKRRQTIRRRYSKTNRTMMVPIIIMTETRRWKIW